VTRARSAITATGLRKSFGDQVVLEGVDLDVAEGTIFTLLGPNGGGKTTIVKILSTLIDADAGTLRVAGHDPARDPDAVRASIGVTGQFAAVDNLLTGEENLILMADLHRLGRAEGRRRAAELLDRFDLVEAARRPAATYSGGMRRRLDLAMTLVGDPRIIFLDEPTTGLDPRTSMRPTSSPTGSPSRPRQADRRGDGGRAQAPHPWRARAAAVRGPEPARVGRPAPQGGRARRRRAHPAARERRQRRIAARAVGPARPRVDRAGRHVGAHARPR
jgi:ABC-type lipopolysaccharide export system ATPase subunit